MVQATKANQNNTAIYKILLPVWDLNRRILLNLNNLYTRSAAPCLAGEQSVWDRGQTSSN